MYKWTVTDDGKKYCSDECFEKSLPKCIICGKPVNGGIIDTHGKIFCDDKCFEKSLPTCSVCGKPIYDGFHSQDDKYFCSKMCYEKTLPHCNTCKKPMYSWIETADGRLFCNDTCKSQYQKNLTKINMETSLTAEELAYITGLTEDECNKLMTLNHINGDQALEAIDIFMESLNNDVSVPIEIATCIRNAGIYSKMSTRLASYNTMRGGVKGYGGFVFEELHAADAATKGINVEIISNNSKYDFIVTDKSGNQTFVQAKAGYKPNQIDWSQYEGQTIVVDKGNTVIAEEARKAGLTVQESGIYKKQADILAKAQQWESSITGKVNAHLTSTVAGAHYAGLASAKLAARVGLSMRLGENIYDILSGDKSFSDAATDVIVDGTIIVGSSYLSGATLSAVGTAVATLGSTAIGTTLTGATTGVATVLGGTAVGSAIVSGVSVIDTGTATALTAIATAPLLPVVAIGATLGAVGKFFRRKK